MKKYLLTYDVYSDHERIIKDLIASNWHSVIQGHTNGKPTVGYLPETTWWKEFETAQQAYDEFKVIAGKQNIERQAVTVFDEWIVSTTNPLKHQKEEVQRLKLINSN